ncbi:MAG: hypothetical protein JNN04_08700 [Cyclobacteriaceae bacterium]|nr:hypothetical protein [Cyclobacteriaceae bacterium]
MPSLAVLAQPQVRFDELSKSPALVGTEFGGALTRRSIIVRDWKDYHLFSLETNSWEKIEFPDQQLRKLHSKGWITCAYLPTFGKVITMGEEIEVLDLQKLTVSYYPVDGTAPVPGGAVVSNEKVYLLGSSFKLDLEPSTRNNPWIPQRVVVPTAYFLVFDPATLRFDVLDTLLGPHFRIGAFAGEKLYAFGPRNLPVPATDVIRYDPALNEWDSVTQLPVQVGAVAELNGMLYLLGLDQDKGFLIRWNPRTGDWKQWRTNVPWTHGLAYIHKNRLYYLAGMKKNPQVRDVFFRHQRWLDRRMYALDLEKLPP